MGKEYVIKKVNRYQSGTGFVALIRDDVLDEVREVDYWISAGVNLDNAISNNIEQFFDVGQVVDEGDKVFDRLKERDKTTIHEDALFAAIQSLRNGGTLDEMTGAIEQVYLDDGTRVATITAFIQAYNNATAAEKSRFMAIMMYLLGAMVR